MGIFSEDLGDFSQQKQRQKINPNHLFMKDLYANEDDEIFSMEKYFYEPQIEDFSETIDGHPIQKVGRRGFGGFSRSFGGSRRSGGGLFGRSSSKKSSGGWFGSRAKSSTGGGLFGGGTKGKSSTTSQKKSTGGLFGSKKPAPKKTGTTAKGKVPGGSTTP